ncbi:PREDICTED: uncharacterized protein LOC109132204 [Camelina sativa]|uniref:Uncharacterized protein LOC109132204 n=1 Tax=Camelina sativa TaxID=90675 RepID=A0ABM1RIX0_CAMSA|nr:PREDICTED: uncharacterized protein LOC109132204 [Camelina sativa]
MLQHRRERDQLRVLRVDDYYTTQSSRTSHRRPQHRDGMDQTYENIGGNKLEIPTFQGRNDPDAYLEWEKKIESVFSYQNYCEMKKVQVAVTGLCDYAITWWDQLVISRRRNGEHPIETWEELKSILRKRYVPNHHHLGSNHILRRPSRPTDGASTVTPSYQRERTSLVFKEEKAAFVSLPSPKEHKELLVQKNLLEIAKSPSEQTEAEEPKHKEISKDQSEEAAKKGIIINNLDSMDDSSDEPTRREKPTLHLSSSKIEQVVDFVGTKKDLTINCANLPHGKPPESLQHSPTQSLTVSRTKLFQEEGYDMIMRPSKTTLESCSTRTKSKINSSYHNAIWDAFLPHLEHISKLNQSNQSLGEGVIHFTNQVNSWLRDLDLRAFKGGFRPSQKYSSYEQNCSEILIHPRTTENWKHVKISSYLKDMDISSQWICPSSIFASEPKIVLHRPT